MNVKANSKKIVKKLIAHSRILSAINEMSKGIVILRYHSILENPDEFDHIIGVPITHSLKTFEKQMAIVARYFNPVSLDDIIHSLRGEKDLPKNAVAVTFDDGYADNLHLAAPILNQYGIPATVYVIADCMERSTLPWFVRLRHAFFTTRVRHWYEPMSTKVIRIDNHQDRLDGFIHACRRCACRVGDKQENYLQAVERSLEVESLENKNIMLTREQVLGLLEMGHTIGCHTRSHPNLAYLREEDVQKEVVESKKMLEETLGRGVRHFSYPNPALYPNHNQMTTNGVAEAGYLSAVTSVSGRAKAGGNSLVLQRMHVPQDVDEFLWYLRWTALGRSL